MKHIVVVLLALGIWFGCGSQSGVTGFMDCKPGDSRPCSCDGGGAGTETCSEASKFEACTCNGLPAQTADGDASSRVCPADAGHTGAPKKCQVCDFDVDRASTSTSCPVAPACANGSLGVPVAPTLRADLSVYTDNGKPVDVDGGVEAPPAPQAACLDPQLRIRLEKLTIHKGGGQAYCIIEANDGITSEAAVTMKTSDLKNGDEFPFPVGQGTLWGQGQPECTANNLTLTYYCFKVVDNSAWAAALKALGDTAVQVGGSPAGAGPYGWAFGVGGAAANAAAAAVTAAQKDENRVRVQQTIPVSSLLDLTNGRTWSVRIQVKDGCNLVGCDRDYDWELSVQAWGCAEKLLTPK